MRCHLKDCWELGVWVCQSCCNKHHRLGRLNNRNVRSLIFGGQNWEVWDQGVGTITSFQVCESVYPPSQHLVVCWPCLGLLGLSTHHPHLCLCVHMAFPLLLWWIGGPSAPMWPHLKLSVPAAAAAAKSLQSCPTLCDPIDGSPPGSPIPGILQARTLEWVAISFSNAWKWRVKMKSLSHVWLFVTPWTAAHQAPPSMGFSRQEYWSGVPLPSPNVPAITLFPSKNHILRFCCCC